MRILLFYFSFLTLLTNAQGPNFQWAKKTGGSNYDKGNALVLDRNRNILVSGYFTGTVDFDPGPGTYTLSAKGDKDVFLSKLAPNGNFLWAKTFGGKYEDAGNALAVDKNGNIYITGYFADTCDFDPGIGISNLVSGYGWDIFINKLDSTGNFIWAKRLGGGYNGSSTDKGYSISTDNNGSVYTTGSFQGNGDFDPGPATYTLYAVGPSGQNDSFISKLDSSGNFKWAKKIGGGGDNVGLDLANDGLGNTYLTGYFSNLVTFGSTTLTATTASDAYITKLDSLGNFLWVKQHSTTGNDVARSVCVDDQNGIYFGETFFGGGSISFGKLDTQGNSVWTKTLTAVAGGGDIAKIKKDVAGNIYIMGSYQSSAMDFDPGPATYTLSVGAWDIFVSKYDNSGNFLWARRFGSTISDLGAGLALDSLGSVYTTGEFSTTADFDPGPGILNISSSGNSDAFIHKLSCPIPPAPTNVTTISNLVVCYNSITTLSVTGSGGILGWYTSMSGGTHLGNGSSFVTPTLTSNTTYYVQDSLCSNGLRTAITVTANPPITSSANYSLCAGDSVKVGIHTYTASGTYTDTLSAINGCDSTVTTNLNIANIIDTTTTLNGIFITATQNGATYKWLDCGNNSVIAGATNQTFTASANGNYAVVITLGVCSDTSACVSINSTLLYYNYLNEPVNIYPNPATEKLHIDLLNYFDKAKVEIYNAIGELIFIEILKNQQNLLNIGDLRTGMYFAKITTNHKMIYVQKVVKQ